MIGDSVYNEGRIVFHVRCHKVRSMLQFAFHLVDDNLNISKASSKTNTILQLNKNRA